ETSPAARRRRARHRTAGSTTRWAGSSSRIPCISASYPPARHRLSRTPPARRERGPDSPRAAPREAGRAACRLGPRVGIGRRARVRVHLLPLPFVGFAHGVPQLCLRELLRRQGFLLLQLAPQVSLLLDRLAGALGVSLELLSPRGKPGLVIGADPRTHVPGTRVRRVVQAGDPGFVLTALLQQTLDDRGALGGAFGHSTNLSRPRPNPAAERKLTAAIWLWRPVKQRWGPPPGARPSHRPRSTQHGP